MPNFSNHPTVSMTEGMTTSEKDETLPIQAVSSFLDMTTTTTTNNSHISTCQEHPDQEVLQRMLLQSN